MLRPQLTLDGAKKNQTQLITEQNEFDAGSMPINPINTAGWQHSSTPVKDAVKLGGGESEAITGPTIGGNAEQTTTSQKLLLAQLPTRQLHSSHTQHSVLNFHPS
jgi:hypothetical protein